MAGNFHFAPGKSFQQSHVHGKRPRAAGTPGELEGPFPCLMHFCLGPEQSLVSGQWFGKRLRAHAKEPDCLASEFSLRPSRLSATLGKFLYFLSFSFLLSKVAMIVLISYAVWAGLR